MIANKTKKTFWRQEQVLLNDCRAYNKTVLQLRGALGDAVDRYQSIFGKGLLVGICIGLAMAHILFFISGRW